MKEYKVNLTSQFSEELEEILYFFPYYQSARKKLFFEIRNTISTLSVFPERYHKINKFKKVRTENIRKLPINKFIMIYEVDNKKEEVYILHIFSEKQDYLNLL